jgi:hypothetical protein
LEQRRSGGGAAARQAAEQAAQDDGRPASGNGEESGRVEMRRCGGGRTIFFRRNKVMEFLQNDRSDILSYTEGVIKNGVIICIYSYIKNIITHHISSIIQ